MKHIKSQLAKLLYFLRLTDDDGLLSITHISCMIVLYKIATAAQPNIEQMAGLLITLSLYYGKRHTQRMQAKATDAQTKSISDLQQKIEEVSGKASGLAAAIGMRNPLIK